MYKAEHFLASQDKLGEGAVWNPEEQTLYWVDIEGHRFSRIHPTTRKYEIFEAGDAIGVLAMRATGGLIMATKHGLASWDFTVNRLTYLGDPEAGQERKRFNDGAIDSAGRFWAATMVEVGARTPDGVLYRFDPDGSVHSMETGLLVPNGIGWSPDNRLMYFTDSDVHTIFVYDFDAESGAISNRRPLIVTSHEPGVPDGLIVDDEGFIWSARWGAGKVVRYDPKGRPVSEILLPVLHPTSCAFGGPRRDELFITSAWTALDAQQRPNYPLAGDLFHVKTDVTGPARLKFLG